MPAQLRVITRPPDARIENYMVVLVTVIHIVVCLFLIIVVLLQSGQSADIAAAFGGMGSQTAFGTRTAATVLSKATTWAAVHLHGHVDHAVGLRHAPCQP